MAGTPESQSSLPQKSNETEEIPPVQESEETLLFSKSSESKAINDLPGTEADQSNNSEEKSQVLSGDFGRYKIEKLLGKGAMGSVYLAKDTQLDRAIALKVPTFAENSPANFIERFLREARSAATLNHPNICPVFDVGEQNGRQFITMGYIEGRPLSDYISTGKIQTERQVANVIRKLALALQEAHEQGIIHRDLKPGNIMIDKRNEPIVMDFGLARQYENEAETKLTQEGTVVGTPAYMAPEQLTDSRELGPATDIYGLGVVLYELLAKQRPFTGSMVTVIGQILHSDPKPIEELRPDISDHMAVICRKALQKSPQDRFASMKEFARELSTLIKGDPEAVTALLASTSKDAEASATQVLEDEFDWNDEDLTDYLPAPPVRTSTKTQKSRKPKSIQPLAWEIGAGILGVALFAVLVPQFSGNEPEQTSNTQTDPTTNSEEISTAKLSPTEDASASLPQQDSQTDDQQRGLQRFPKFPKPGQKIVPRIDFQRFDQNNDETLDPTEFPLHIINRADLNRDNELDFSEFSQAIRDQGTDLFIPPKPGDRIDPNRENFRPGNNGKRPFPERRPNKRPLGKRPGF